MRAVSLKQRTLERREVPTPVPDPARFWFAHLPAPCLGSPRVLANKPAAPLTPVGNQVDQTGRQGSVQGLEAWGLRGIGKDIW